jgi:hypothetical protein
LRAAIIVSALALHFDTRFGLGDLAEPFRFIQRNIFSVGGFFFFTAGFMACRVYLPRFRGEPVRTGAHLLRKGTVLLAVYVSYVCLLRLATATPFPKGLVGFLLDHPFFVKVLLTFGLLYLLMPCVLWAAVRSRWLVVGLAAIAVGVHHAYNPSWPMPYSLRALVFDKAMFVYALLPSSIIAASG